MGLLLSFVTSGSRCLACRSQPPSDIVWTPPCFASPLGGSRMAPNRLSLDDQLWHQALLTSRCHQEVERATGARASPDWAGVQQTDDDQVLLKLLERRITNQLVFNKPFDVLTCSMCFTAVMGDCLWSLLERKRPWVGGITQHF